MKIQMIVAGLLILATACGSARRGPTVGGGQPGDQPEIVRGEKVYMNFCNGCHPGGAAGLGSAINNKPLPGFMIKWQVRDGLGVMPAFKKEVIAPEKLDDLVAYLKALRRSGAS